MGCPCRDIVPVLVRIPADLSCSGRAKWKWARIDKCIAPLVEALQLSGIDMRGSCCGHGGDGDIHLQDGRILIIKRDAVKYLAQRKRKKQNRWPRISRKAISDFAHEISNLTAVVGEYGPEIKEIEELIRGSIKKWRKNVQRSG